MIYIGNAFSLSMIEEDRNGKMVCISRVGIESVVNFIENIGQEVMSCIGHESTAQIIRKILLDNVFNNEELKRLFEEKVVMNRVNVRLTEKDFLIVFQYNGGRLPEGEILNNLSEKDFTIRVVRLA